MGCALARSLSSAGYTLTACVDKCATSAQNMAAELKLKQFASTLEEIGTETEVLIVAVPDSQIPVLDHEIAKIIPNTHLKACVHTSGTLSGSVFKEVSACGIPVGSLHPLMTFPSSENSPVLNGVYFAIEGDPSILELLDELVV